MILFKFLHRASVSGKHKLKMTFRYDLPGRCGQGKRSETRTLGAGVCGHVEQRRTTRNGRMLSTAKH